jgi:replication factor C subunit 3/5
VLCLSKKVLECISQAQQGELPHLLVYGPHGAGKRTHVRALLREIYGDSYSTQSATVRTFRLKYQKTVDVDLQSTSHSVELSPVGLEDQCATILQQIISDMAETRPQKGLLNYSSTNAETAGHHFKVLFIRDADSLPHQAQAALRRTMETNTSVCRLILCCTSSNRILEPIRSRCLNVRIPAPSEESIHEVLKSVAGHEGHQLKHSVSRAILKANGRDMRRCLTALQSFYTTKGVSIEIAVTAPWQLYLDQLADDMIKEKGLSNLSKYRARFVELQTCVSISLVFKRMMRVLLHKLKREEDKHKVLQWAAECDARMCARGEACIHVEAFMVKVLEL